MVIFGAGEGDQDLIDVYDSERPMITSSASA
jgi:hypothetical protein